MKRLLFLFPILLLIIGAVVPKAVENINIPSMIEKINIFRQGAQVYRTANTAIPQGEHTLVFDGLAASTNPNSLQFGIKNEAVQILDVKFTTYNVNKEDLIPENVKTEYQNYKDKKQELSNGIELLNAEASILNSQKNLIANNKMMVDKGEMEDIKFAYDFFPERFVQITKRLQEIESAKTALAEQLLELNKGWQEKSQQFTAEANSNNMGKFIVKVKAEKAITANFNFSYQVGQASWQPFYDIKTKNIDSPMDIVYKAKITQRTGIDWKDANLIISTGNPTANNDRPILTPFYANFYIEQARRNESSLEYDNLRLQNSYAAEGPQAYQGTSESDISPNVSIVEQYVESDNSPLITFELPYKHSIPSDGDYHTVILKEETIDAKYVYHAVPKKACTVYLLAKIKDWGKLNLMSGNANLFAEGNYVGQTYINAQMVSEELILSLGIDERISIKRYPLEKKGSKDFFGGNKTENLSYEILIKNNKPQTINLELLDQIPLSNNTEIEITPGDLGGAEYTKEYGKLLWDLEVKPQEVKKVQFGFTAKYPKNKKVTGL